MNIEKVSHHTTAVLYRDASNDCGIATMKFSKVFTSPTRTERPLIVEKSFFFSTNSATGTACNPARERAFPLGHYTAHLSSNGWFGGI